MGACDASKTAAQYKAAVSWRLRRRRGIDHSLPHCFYRVKFVLVGNNHVPAFFQATGHLCEIKGAKSNPNCARMHNAMVHDERLIDKESTRRHQMSVLMRASDDVHLPGHSHHQIVGWIFHFQHNGVTLRGWIGGGLN